MNVCEEADLIAVGSDVKEPEVVSSLLGGLPPAYSMAVEVPQMSDDLSFQKTLPKLMQVEQRILVQPSAHYKEAMVQAFGANVKRCFYCNQPGHIKAMCHRRKADMQRKAEDAPKRVVAF